MGFCVAGHGGWVKKVGSLQSGNDGITQVAPTGLKLDFESLGELFILLTAEPVSVLKYVIML
jgi:hypothetical protein